MKTKTTLPIAFALAAMAVLPAAVPAAPADAAQAEYQREVARCNSGAAGVDRATCLREAGAALQEARSGRLAAGGNAAYERNRLARCDALPAADRPDCVKRMTQGTTSGSVEGGGILREYRETVPATR